MTDRDEPLDDNELRLECLKMAMDVGRDPMTVLAVAREFANFVFGYAPEDPDESAGNSPAPPGPDLTPEQRTKIQTMFGWL